MGVAKSTAGKQDNAEDPEDSTAFLLRKGKDAVADKEGATKQKAKTNKPISTGGRPDKRWRQGQGEKQSWGPSGDKKPSTSSR